jgi:hypothetical protein
MATKDRQALDDRGLIRWQMVLGSGLIAFGALSIPLFQLTGVLDGQAVTPGPERWRRRPARAPR